MNTKPVSLVTLGFVLFGILLPSTVSAEILVGVKAGDRMEYNVDYYGAGEPPAVPYLIWHEIEVLSVQGTTVTFDMTRRFSDGTLETDTLIEDLETGVYELLIIPANLSNGDVFDHEGYGHITVSGVEEKIYAGAKRTVVKAMVANMSYIWDKTAGVLAGWLFYSEYFGAYMNVELTYTNIWQREFSLPIDPTLLYMLIIAAVAIVAAVVFFVIRRSKRKVSRRKKRVSKKKN